MKKVFNLVLGGIQQKVFNLVLVTTIFILIAFSIVLNYQSRALSDLVQESAESHEAAIDEITSETMRAVVDSSLTRTIGL